ncbi:type II toxin-antitoxin system MqsA family antitoxin [Blautia sp. NSJ-159]|nr:type II toxin-antitoxin system MqsA family antitoxin [Blautia sp. NSJ-159]MCJ8043341.1 type II toxin-antitoxin system MqsA family antitoxin [Blautia sp. NSJ-165]
MRRNEKPCVCNVFATPHSKNPVKSSVLSYPNVNFSSARDNQLHIAMYGKPTNVKFVGFFELNIGSRFQNQKGAINMLCMECGAKAEKGLTTDVTDLGSCLVIVRNVPCYKCIECNEVIYTADVVKQLENIIEQAKKVMQEISIVDYSKVA